MNAQNYFVMQLKGSHVHNTYMDLKQLFQETIVMLTL